MSRQDNAAKIAAAMVAAILTPITAVRLIARLRVGRAHRWEFAIHGL
jgi:hypothetical protein